MMFQDVCFTFRILKRHPALYLSVILLLALGIGFNSTVFSIANAVLLRPLPLPHEDRLFVVTETKLQKGISGLGVSGANLIDLQKESRLTEILGGYIAFDVQCGPGGRAELVPAATITQGMADLMEATPVLGRFFEPADFTSHDAAPVVLSQSFWRDRLGADPAVVGRAITIGNTSRTIVGVLPERIVFPYPLSEQKPVLWTPYALGPGEHRRGNNFSVIGRLSPGASLGAVRTELRGIEARLAREYPRTNAGWSVDVEALRSAVTKNIRASLLLLSSSVAAIWLIACVNVGCLLLVRTMSRSSEWGTRLAMGASGGRLVRQLLTEGLVLALFAGLLGLVFAIEASRLIRAGIGSVVFVPGIEGAGVDPLGVFFVILTAILSLGLFSILPILRASRAETNVALRTTSSRSRVSPGGFLGPLISVQVMITVLLVMTAVLLAKNMWSEMERRAGYPLSSIFSAELTLPNEGYGKAFRRVQSFQTIVQAVSRMPGVVSVGLVDSLTESKALTSEVVSEGSADVAGSNPVAAIHVVTPGYFRVLGSHFSAGENFQASGGFETEHQAVLSESARRGLLERQPLGKRLRLQFLGSDPYIIVGVIPDVPDPDGIARRPVIYVPQGGAHASSTRMWIVARVATRQGPTLLTNLAGVIRGAVSEVRVQKVSSMAGVFDREVAFPRLRTLVVSLLAALALVLAFAGIFGITRFVAAQRERDMGVRMALGARPNGILGLLLWEGLKPVLAGIALGLLGFNAQRRLIGSFVPNLGNVDGTAILTTFAILLIVFFASLYFPARRASRKDPLAALKSN